MQTIISAVSEWMLPLLITGILLVGAVRRVPIYNTFIDGAKSGFGTSIRLIPHLIAMMVAVQVFRASGAMDLLMQLLDPALSALHIPTSVAPMALLRPISNMGSLALMTDVFKTQGPDSWVGQLASTMQAASDTTLYVITVYFGSVGIQKMRYALKVGFLADFASVIGSVVAVYLLLGPMPNK